jgi:hypothetical protein
MRQCPVTLTHYREILAMVKAEGFRFWTFGEKELPTEDEKVFLMRHDIDVDPFLARDMARIEAEYGARATYFFLPTTPLYNMSSVEVQAALKEIQDFGGDIQLHFDASPFFPKEMENSVTDETKAHLARVKWDMEWAIQQEAQIMYDIVKKEVCAVSYHRPRRVLLNTEFDHLPKFRCTYSARFQDPHMQYVSDSAGQWHPDTGCVCDYLKARNQIHCLIHPIWWGDPALSVYDTLQAFLVRHRERADALLTSEIRSYNGTKDS